MIAALGVAADREWRMDAKEVAGIFFFTLVTGPRRSLSLKLSDTRVYEPQMLARLGTTAHFCKVVVLTFTETQRVGSRRTRGAFSARLTLHPQP